MRMCSREGSANCARVLILAKASVAGSRLVGGDEPLHIAAYKCDESIVAYLIEKGAEDKKDSTGNTASKLADRSGRRKSRELIDAKFADDGKAGSGRGSRRASKESAGDKGE